MYFKFLKIKTNLLTTCTLLDVLITFVFLFRLYTEGDYNAMAEMFVPEILRVNLGQTLLYLMSMKIENPLNFDFIERPSPTIFQKAHDLLVTLGAVEGSSLTEIGQKMAKISLEPRLSKFVLSACNENAIDEAVVVAACVSVGNLFYRMGTDELKEQADICKLEFSDDVGDSLTFLKVFSEWSKLRQNEKGRWCAEKFINGKCMKAVEETVKEIRYVLGHDLQISVSQKLNLDLSKADQTLPALYFRCFSDNIAIYSGHPRVGYFSPSINDYIFIHPGSSVYFCDTISPWIVFEYVLKTSKSFAVNILTVKEDWLTDVNLLPLIDVCRQKVVVPIELNKWGSLVKRHLWKNREVLSKIPDNSPCIMEMNFNDPWLVFKIFCSPSFKIQLENAAMNLARDVLDQIRNDHLEQQNRNSKLRVCIGAGGEVRELLTGGEYRTVFVNNVPQNVSSVEEVKALFSLFGKITKCVKYQCSPHVYKIEKWGLISFSSYDEARLAYKNMKDEQEYVLQPQLPRQSSIDYGKMNETFPIRITWCRRQSRNMGFITLSTDNDIINAIVYLRNHLNATVGRKKPNAEKHDIFVRNLPPSMTSKDLETLVHSLLDPHNILFENAYVVLEKSFETPDALLEHYHGLLKMHFLGYSLSEDEFDLTVEKPRSPSDTLYRAVCCIKDEHKAAQVLKVYAKNHFQINLRPVKFEADIRMEVIIATRIYNIMASAFDELADDVSKKYSKEVVRLEIVTLKSGRIVGRISGSDYERALQVRALLQEQMRGDEIDCSHGILKILLTPVGEKFLRKLEKDYEIFISVGKIRQQIHLFGAQVEVTKTKIEINKFLELKSGNCFENFQLELKPPEWPLSTIKILLKKFNNSLDHIVCEIDECSGIQINFVKRHIIFSGSKKGYETLIEILKNCIVDSKLQINSTVETPECVTCFCPTSENVYCLEFCGHYYCHECVVNQLTIAIRDKQFPVICVKENCNQPFVIRDFENILIGNVKVKDKVNEAQKLQPLVDASLSHFVAKNKSLYAYCSTPDCYGVFKVK